MIISDLSAELKHWEGFPDYPVNTMRTVIPTSLSFSKD